MPTKNSNMPFLSLHSLAAARGDGLRPEFVDLFKRLATGADATLSKSCPFRKLHPPDWRLSANRHMIAG
jgi:hypothetical protein